MYSTKQVLSFIQIINSGIEKGVVKGILNIAGSTLQEDISGIEKDAEEDVLNIAKDITEVKLLQLLYLQ